VLTWRTSRVAEGRLVGPPGGGGQSRKGYGGQGGEEEISKTAGEG